MVVLVRVSVTVLTVLPPVLVSYLVVVVSLVPCGSVVTAVYVTRISSAPFLFVVTTRVSVRSGPIPSYVVVTVVPSLLVSTFCESPTKPGSPPLAMV